MTIFSTLAVHAQRGKENIVTDNVKPNLSKTELRFMGAKIDSIKFNLNRMIIFEKELKQRNYYLNEKTALVDELVAIVQSLKKSLDVVDLKTKDLKNIFGKVSHKSPKVWIYEIETFESNCPFIQITFYLLESDVTRLEYKITDCQRWK